MTGVLVLAALLAQAPAQKAAIAPLIDNQRVRVWHQRHPLSSTLDAIHITVTADSPAQVSFLPKGSPAQTSAATLFIELKDLRIAPIPNPTNYPLAFPRPAIKKLLENDRVIVWDYTWTLNSPTGMHFHDKDVVVMFLEEGDLQSTVPDGGKTLNPYKPGTIRFNARDRVHFETLTRGKQRAIITELK